jgi:hypothetical protein
LGLKVDSFNICEYHTLKGTELDILTPHVAETPIVGHQKKKKVVEIESADHQKHAEILQINVDVKPLDANPPVDLRIKLKTQPILIKFSRPLIDKIGETIEAYNTRYSILRHEVIIRLKILDQQNNYRFCLFKIMTSL